MKKLIFAFAILFCMAFLFAEEKEFQFSNVAEDSLIIKVNDSQKTFEKKVKVSGSGIRLYAERPMAYFAAQSMSVVFIEPLVIENAASMKSAKISGKSLGYNATVILHFENSRGDKKRVVFKDAVPMRPDDYELVWDNSSYIEDVRDRNPVLKPVWPFNASNLYLVEIEFHLNSVMSDPHLANYPFNAQELTSVSFIYDKDSLEGKDLETEFEADFGVEGKLKARMDKRSEKLRLEKKAAEEDEKARQATEDYYGNAPKQQSAE